MDCCYLKVETYMYFLIIFVLYWFLLPFGSKMNQNGRTFVTWRQTLKIVVFQKSLYFVLICSLSLGLPYKGSSKFLFWRTMNILILPNFFLSYLGSQSMIKCCYLKKDPNFYYYYYYYYYYDALIRSVSLGWSVCDRPLLSERWI